MAAKTRKTAKGNIFTRGKSKVWYVQFYADGKQHLARLLNADGTRCQNRAEAEAARERLLAPLLATDRAEQLRRLKSDLSAAEDRAAELIEAARPRIPIAEAWKRWPYVRNRRGSTERELSETSIKDNRSLWGRFETWAAGAGLADMEAVTAADANEFRETQITEGLSGHRVNLACLTARVMFDAAGIKPNPFSGQKRRAHVSHGRRELTPDELRAVCSTATGELRTLLALGLYCGFRLGDACLLTWDEVAADLGTITRIPGKVAYKGKAVSIPVHPVLAAILAETPRPARRGPVLPDMAAKYDRDRPAVSRIVQEHFTACGIRTQATKTGRGTAARAVVEAGFHSLRHGFISEAARANIPLHVVRDLVGHNSPRVQELYLHANQADRMALIKALPDMSGNGTAPDPAEDAARARLRALADSLPLARVLELLESEAAR